MKLYIMRHGTADDAAASGRDVDRALTHGGRDRVRSVAKALLDAHEEPLSIITSPLVRAVETAEIVAVATNLAERGGTVEVARALAPSGGRTKLVEELVGAGRKRVMLVGHEPDLSDLVAALIKTPMPVSMDKAMVVGLHIPTPRSAAATDAGKLRFIFDPKTLTWRFDARSSAELSAKPGKSP